MTTACHRAAWILPMCGPPVRDGWIETEGGRIVRVGAGAPPRPAVDLGRTAVLPGLVNAHTHLELSWMAGLVPPASSLSDWLRDLIAKRAAGPPGGPLEAVAAARQAAVDAVRTGTVLVGDISNTLMTPPLLREVGLGGVVFHELIGFNTVDPALVVRQATDRMDAVRAATATAEPEIALALSAHAPYSVAPALFTEIARRSAGQPMAVHLAESAEEIEFLRTGRGPFRTMLESLGVWHEGWAVPGCDPVTYLERCHYLSPTLLAVHGVLLTDAGVEKLAHAGATLVTCPRSNAWVGAGLPRLSHLYGTGLPVAVGTDSLASVPSLSLFDELAEMRRIAPEVSASALLASATRVGAEALGMEQRYGTIEPGRSASLVAVSVPDGVLDVEEYLVSGVPAGAVHAFTPH